jgi:hypothetical protein
VPPVLLCCRTYAVGCPKHWAETRGSLRVENIAETVMVGSDVGDDILRDDTSPAESA